MSVMPTLDWVTDPVTKLRAGKEALKRVHDRLAPPSEEPAAVRDDERAVWRSAQDDGRLSDAGRGRLPEA